MFSSAGAWSDWSYSSAPHGSTRLQQQQQQYSIPSVMASDEYHAAWPLSIVISPALESDEAYFDLSAANFQQTHSSTSSSSPSINQRDDRTSRRRGDARTIRLSSRPSSPYVMVGDSNKSRVAAEQKIGRNNKKDGSDSSKKKKKKSNRRSDASAGNKSAAVKYDLRNSPSFHEPVRSSHDDVGISAGLNIDDRRLEEALRRAVEKSVRKAVRESIRDMRVASASKSSKSTYGQSGSNSGQRLALTSLSNHHQHGSKNTKYHQRPGERRSEQPIPETSRQGSGETKDTIRVLVPKTPTFVPDTTDILIFSLILVGGFVVPQSIYGWLASFVDENQLPLVPQRMVSTMADTWDWFLGITGITHVLARLTAFITSRITGASSSLLVT